MCLIAAADLSPCLMMSRALPNIQDPTSWRGPRHSREIFHFLMCFSVLKTVSVLTGSARTRLDLLY